MLCMMIDDPRQPRNDIDVYLAPLTEDLTKLFVHEVDVYDGNLRQTFSWYFIFNGPRRRVTLLVFHLNADAFGDVGLQNMINYLRRSKEIVHIVGQVASIT